MLTINIFKNVIFAGNNTWYCSIEYIADVNFCKLFRVFFNFEIKAFKYINLILTCVNELQVPTTATLFPPKMIQCKPFLFLSSFDWDSTIYTALKSTYWGTWIRRNIKESTSVSLSGSPLYAWSFLICWGGKRDRGSSAGAFFSSSFNVFCHQFWSLIHSLLKATDTE